MLNILDIAFLGLASAVTFTGFLINNFEKHVPAFIIKGFRYGSFAYKGSDANFLQLIEIPKSWYRHFYLFATCFGSVTLIYIFAVYYLDYGVHKYVSFFLRIFLEQDEPSVSATAVMIVMSLLMVQCVRRFYETYFVQVFAKSSRMNLSHYLAGIIHYFACFVAAVGQGPLFCGSQNRENVNWNDTPTKVLAGPCIAVFLWAWYEQYQSNLIFANLRKDKKSGEVVTEDHGLPKGRMFQYVSSPHRMCELLMYTVLLLLIPTKTFFCIYLWVLANQIQTAIQAHEWYKKTFKNYPKERNAIFPHVL
ncbi:polyprenol reductase [Ostrinia nubilalis]|uniref:polyprenol reductase n=1 Tax=Ostrinia nubilalis TaxID=29057 RepID=UPI0030822835